MCYFVCLVRSLKMTAQVKMCQGTWPLQVNLFPFLVNLPVSKMSHAYDFFFFKVHGYSQFNSPSGKFPNNWTKFPHVSISLLVHKHSGFALYRHFHSTLLFFSSLGIRPVCYPSVFLLSFNHLIIHDCPKTGGLLSVQIVGEGQSLPGLPRACFFICEKLWI